MKFKEQIVTTVKFIIDFVRIIFRRLRLIRLNRNFLVFLLFLAISIGFWTLKTLNEETTVSINYKLKVLNVPKNVILTSEVPKHIKVNISGRGWNIIPLYTKNKDHAIAVSYDQLEYTNSKITVDNAIMRRSVSKDIGNAIKVVSMSPSLVDLYYTKGKGKIVPIIFSGDVKAEFNHILCGTELLTTTAQVFAPITLYDSIKYVSTEKIYLDNIEDTIVKRVALKQIEGVKIIPDSVDVKICVDLFMEASMSVPIYCNNIPKNKILRTFPPKATVKFKISATQLNEIDEKDFVLEVDFSKIKNTDKHCKVTLSDIPEGVSQVSIHPDEVEFVIEQVDN